MNDKDYFLPLVTLLALPLILIDPFFCILLIITFGQGHFVHAYYYQYKSGKIGLSFCLKALLAVLLFVLVLYFSAQFVVVFGMVIFLIHSYFDSARLVNRAHDYFSLMSLFCAVLSVFIIEFITTASFFFVVVSTIGFFTALFSRNRWSAFHVILPFFVASLLILVLPGPVSKMSIYAASIVSHYALWFFYIYFRSSPEKRKRFSIEFICLSLFFGALAFGSMKSIEFEPVLFLFFSMNAYVLWTTVHIFTTFNSAVFFGKFRR